MPWFFRFLRPAHLGLAAILAGASLPVAVQAEPGGCLKYGAVGAVGGHLAHHGVLGAAGGCAAGMWKRHEYRKNVRNKAHLYDQEHRADTPAATGEDPNRPTDGQHPSF